MVAPGTARMRAALLATEASLLGLCCGGAVAGALLAATHGRVAAQLFEPALWLFGGAGLLGSAISIAGRILEVGEAPRRPPVLHRLWRPMIAASAGCTGCIFAALFSAGSLVPGAGAEVFAATAAGIGALGLVGLSLRLRTAQASSVRARPAVATLAQPVAHSLLSGMAGLLFIGLATGRVTAGLTYHVGVGVTALAAATALWTAVCLRGARVRLQLARASGARWPLAEHGYRLSALSVMVGLLLPAVVVIADLLAARLTLLAIACAMLALSGHALRHALALTELAMPPRRPRPRDLPSMPSTAPPG